MYYLSFFLTITIPFTHCTTIVLLRFLKSSNVFINWPDTFADFPLPSLLELPDDHQQNLGRHRRWPKVQSICFYSCLSCLLLVAPSLTVAGARLLWKCAPRIKCAFRNGPRPVCAVSYRVSPWLGPRGNIQRLEDSTISVTQNKCNWWLILKDRAWYPLETVD